MRSTSKTMRPTRLKVAALMGALFLTLGLGQTALAGQNGDRDQVRKYQHSQSGEYRGHRDSGHRDSGHDYRRGDSRHQQGGHHVQRDRRYSFGQHHSYRQRHFYGQRRHYHKPRHGQGRHYGWTSPHVNKGKHYGWTAPYVNRGRHQGHQVACQRVTRHGYWGGRPAQIAGLKCFDRYGRAYIKPGSHRVLRYYPQRFVFRGDQFSFAWR